MLLVRALRVFCFMQVRENGEKMFSRGKLVVRFIVWSAVILGRSFFAQAEDVNLEKIVVP